MIINIYPPNMPNRWEIKISPHSNNYGVRIGPFRTLAVLLFEISLFRIALSFFSHLRCFALSKFRIALLFFRCFALLTKVRKYETMKVRNNESAKQRNYETTRHRKCETAKQRRYFRCYVLYLFRAVSHFRCFVVSGLIIMIMIIIIIISSKALFQQNVARSAVQYKFKKTLFFKRWVFSADLNTVSSWSVTARTW